jgi:tRNA G26 N,N-dimethylase Trm1
MYLFFDATKTNKRYFACAECHLVEQTAASSQAAAVACPGCHRAMHNMGPGFIPPKATDQQQWQKVAQLVAHDFTFEYLPQ